MVINYSKEGKKITDMTKIVIPVNEKTVRAYELLTKGLTRKKGEIWKYFQEVL